MSSMMSDCCRRAIENYKSNNSHLACALNEQREQSRIARDDFSRICREFQEKCEENVQLKAALERKEAQMEMWKKKVREVVQHNSSGLGQLIGLFGAQPQLIDATSSNNGLKAEQGPSTASPNAAKTETKPKIEQTSSVKKIPRRKSMFAEKRNDLPHLTEECQEKRSPPQKRRASVDTSPSAGDSSFASNSSVASSSPELPITPRRTLRRSASISPASSISSSSSPESSPPTPPTPALVRKTARRHSEDSASVLIAQKASQNDNTKKTIGRGQSVPEKENNMVNGERRPRRKAAPAHLKEEKLNVKLRRKQ